MSPLWLMLRGIYLMIYMIKLLRIILGILLTLGSIGYLLPTGIAIARGRTNTASIFVLNLFLGWTFVAWVIALMWSVAKDSPHSI